MSDVAMASLPMLLPPPSLSPASLSSSSSHNQPSHRMPCLPLRTFKYAPFQVLHSSFPSHIPRNAIEQSSSENTGPSSLDNHTSSAQDASSYSNLDGSPSFHHVPNVASRKKKRRPDIPAQSGRLESSPAIQRLNGALSTYLGSEPRRRERLLNPQERLAAVESVMTAQSLLHALDGVRFKLDHSDFNTILRRFGGLEKWKHAILVFDWMKVNKKLIPSSVTSFMSMMGKAGLPEKALRAYKGLTDSNMRRNKSVCNALFKTLIESGPVEKAFNLFDGIKVDGFIPDLYTYSILISGCVRHQSAYTKAESLMEEMSDRGLKPDSFIYESLLSLCAHFGLENKAVSLFEQMKADKVSPNIFHYSSMIDVYVEQGKPEEAEKMFQQRKEAGFPLNQVMLTTLLKAYCNGGMLGKAKTLFDEMQYLGFCPENVDFGVVLSAYREQGYEDAIPVVINYIGERGSGKSNE